MAHVLSVQLLRLGTQATLGCGSSKRLGGDQLADCSGRFVGVVQWWGPSHWLQSSSLLAGHLASLLKGCWRAAHVKLFYKCLLRENALHDLILRSLPPCLVEEKKRPK